MLFPISVPSNISFLKRPIPLASHLHVPVGGTSGSVGSNTTPLTKGPASAAIDTVVASAHIRSALDGNFEYSKWLCVSGKARGSVIDALRADPNEAGKVSLYEWAHDHETSANYGKVRLDDAKGDRDDYCAGHVDVVEKAGNQINSHRTNDARSMNETLEPCLERAGVSKGEGGMGKPYNDPAANTPPVKNLIRVLTSHFNSIGTDARSRTISRVTLEILLASIGSIGTQRPGAEVFQRLARGLTMEPKTPAGGDHV